MTFVPSFSSVFVRLLIITGIRLSCQTMVCAAMSNYQLGGMHRQNGESLVTVIVNSEIRGY